jgi:F-type H+-transporting ATPase subunit epsilon
VANGKLHCTVVTPESAVFDDEADQIVIPSHDGEIGILPGHARLLAKLGAGELRVTTGGKTETKFVDGGFVQVAGNKVTVLTDSACEMQHIDLAEAKQRVDSLRNQGRGAEFAAANHRWLTMKRVKERFERS